jgi:putative endonuclease
VAANFWVYVLTSASGNAMYIGVTNSLEKRLWEHRSGSGSEFAKKYRVTRLVYAEEPHRRHSAGEATEGMAAGTEE